MSQQTLDHLNHSKIIESGLKCVTSKDFQGKSYESNFAIGQYKLTASISHWISLFRKKWLRQ